MAALNETGDTITISMINPTGKEITLKIEGMDLPPEATQYVITGKTDASHNAPGEKRGVDIIDKDKVSITDGLNAMPLSANIWKISL